VRVLVKAILFFSLAVAIQAQTDTTKLVWFTQKNVVDIANRMRTLKFEIVMRDTLILQLSDQVADYEVFTRLKDSSIRTLKMQIGIFKTNEELHERAEKALKQEIENLQPSWTTSPLLWCGAGLTAGYFLFYKRNRI
jgi:hypothetical protein